MNREKGWEQFLRMHKLSELINEMLKQPNRYRDELKELMDRRHLANNANFQISAAENQAYIDRLEEVKS